MFEHWLIPAQLCCTLRQNEPEYIWVPYGSPEGKHKRLILKTWLLDAGLLHSSFHLRSFPQPNICAAGIVSIPW